MLNKFLLNFRYIPAVGNDSEIRATRVGNRVNLSDSFYVPTADKTASVMLLSELGDEVSSKKELDSTTEYIRPFFGRSNRNDGRELKRHASRNTDLSQKQLICIRISDTQSLPSGRESGGRGFPAVSGRTVDLDIELVVCRCGTLTKTCIMTPPVHSKLTAESFLLLLPLQGRYAVRQRFNSTKQQSSAQYTQRPTKETKTASWHRPYYLWAPESSHWLMSWEDAAVVIQYRSSVCSSSSSRPPSRPPFYCYCIIASVTRYGRPWIIAFCAFAARVPLYCSLNYRSLIFVVLCSPLRDAHVPQRSRWTNSTELCCLCLYRFRNRNNFSAVVC